MDQKASHRRRSQNPGGTAWNSVYSPGDQAPAKAEYHLREVLWQRDRHRAGNAGGGEYLYVRLVDYSGKIRLIMLHKPKFAGRSACSTPITCDANSIRALDPGVGASSLESFSTPSASVNHFMAVTEELLNHILALLPILWPQNSKNKLHFGRRERLTTRCHELLHKAES